MCCTTFPFQEDLCSDVGGTCMDRFVLFRNESKSYLGILVVGVKAPQWQASVPHNQGLSCAVYLLRNNKTLARNQNHPHLQRQLRQSTWFSVLEEPVQAVAVESVTSIVEMVLQEHCHVQEV